MKDNPIVLYGAGEQNCGNAYDFLYSAGLGVEFICDKDTLLQDTQFLGISIKSPAILKEFDKKNQCWYLIITARESKTVLSIRKSINDLELKHARVLTFLEFLEQKQLQSKAKRIACINVHAVLSCNFNCARCCAFSPLAKTPGLLDTQGFENDLKRLSVLTEGNLLEFHIEGGEPTLHPRLSEITNMVGKYFPQTYIKIITNGLTIKTLSDLFWESCKINNVKIEVTKYPITLPYGDLLEFIRSKGIESVYGNTGNSETQKQFTNFTQLNIEGVNRGGGNNREESFLKCKNSSGEYFLREGTLYRCGTASTIDLFNNFFDKTLPQGVINGVDIYKVQNQDELLRKLNKSIPLCRHCDFPDEYKFYDFEISKREISEWESENER